SQQLDRLQQGLSVLLAPYDFLSLSESSSTLSAEHLRSLLDVREKFGIDEAQLQPSLHGAERLASRVCGQARKDSLSDRGLELLTVMDRLIVRSLEQGLEDRRILRTADFEDLKSMEIPDGVLNSRGEKTSLFLYLGTIASLRPDHWLRCVL